MRGINERVAELLSEAMCAEDAEAKGVDACRVVADPDRAVSRLGAPGLSRTARDAVVQRFGGVGALLVVACEEAWLHRQTASIAGEDRGTGQLRVECRDLENRDHEHRGSAQTDPMKAWLGELLDRFTELSPTEMHWLVEQVETHETRAPSSESAAARRWLHVTYAIAARDGTDEAHRAYVQALDGVLDQTRALVAI